MKGRIFIRSLYFVFIIAMLIVMVAPGALAADEHLEKVGRSAAVNRGEKFSNGDPGPAYLVKDINPTGFSSLGEFCDGNGILYFSADDGTNGNELWVSDGTEAGTMMVKNIAPGSGSSFSTKPCFYFNQEVYFIANDGTHGSELWKSDGSESGTQMVMDIYLDSGSSLPNEFKVIDNTLYFFADDGINGRELWKSDGSESGTEMVKDINTSGSSFPDKLTIMNGMLYFTADDGIHGIELWKSDGTELNTKMVKDINESDSSFVVIKAPGNGLLYFYADDGTHGYELWVSDGTETGTEMVKDINPESGDSYWLYGYFITTGDNIFFTADDGTHGVRLWFSDGTETGTVLLGTDNPGGFDCFNGCIYTIIDESLVFGAGTSSDGFELWVSDGSIAGTKMLKDIYPGSDSGIICYWNCSWINADGVLYFAASDGSNGRELWVSDGTEAGTKMVKDIKPSDAKGDPSSDPKIGYYLGDILYFSADDGSLGYELWQSDGTESGTRMVQDINSGLPGSMPGLLTLSGSNIFFIADDGIHGYELWALPVPDSNAPGMFLPLVFR